MQAPSFDETLDKIVQRDTRYHADAYHFVREALDYTHKLAAKGAKAKARHVTGQQLLNGIRAYAIDQFGPMALMVLNEWGVRACEDFGEIVFNMVETNLLGKTENDRRDDFKGGYAFEEAFRQPYLPTGKDRARERDSSPTEV